MVDKVQMIGTAFLPMDRVNKKILVSKRSMNKKYFPGFWEVLGGNLEFGEDELEDFEFCPGDVELLKLGFKKI